jgi:hypothetical protein
MKCGWCNLRGSFYSGEEDAEPARFCDNDATHTSCDYGPVCSEHRCRCSKLLSEVELEKFRRDALQKAFDEGEGVP